jgi:hypothetical protein
MTIMVEKAPNFSVAQEARIREVAASGPDGKLNLELATALAAEFSTPENERKVRSVIAKANRMNVPYARKQPTTKSGDPVVKKADLVAQIAASMETTVSALDGLDKAPKAALQRIATALAA